MIDGIIDFSSVDTTNSRDSNDFGFRASINRIHCITGTILGDGYIRPSTLTKNGIICGNARLSYDGKYQLINIIFFLLYYY